MLVRLAMMTFIDLNYVPAPLLFVKATGVGKSLVRDIHSVMFRCISLTIVLLLVLGAEQSSNLLVKTTQTLADVLSICLDKVHSQMDNWKLITSILVLPSYTRKTVMLFTSPQ